MTNIKSLSLLLLSLLFLLAPARLLAYAHWEGYCQQGGQKVVTSSTQSTTSVQQSYPQATLTVYITGSSPLTKATLYSDAAGTSLANPLTCSTKGYFSFYSAAASLDLTFSGVGISAPFTWGAVTATEPLGVISDIGWTGTFAALCSQASGFGRTLVISRLWTGVVAVPCSIFAVQGGKLRIAASTAAVVAQDFTCPMTQQCFDTTTNSGASVTFTHIPAPVSVMWWGTDGVAIQAALKAAMPAVATGGGNVIVPPGTYDVAATITYPPSQGGKFCGSGLRSVLRWTGTTGIPMLNIVDSPLTEICNMQLLYTSAHPGDTAIKVGHGTAGDISSAVDINHVWINGDLHLAHCIVYDGVDANDDFMSVEYSTITGTTDYAVVINGQNAVGNLFVQVRCAQAYGCVKATNNGAGAGSFSWYGGTTNTTHASFEVVGFTAYGITLKDGNSEDEGKFIIASSGVGLGNIIVENWNWARANLNPASPIFIDMSGAAALTLRGGFYKFNDSLGSLAQIKYQHFGATSSSPTVNLIDTNFETETVTEAGLFAAGSSSPSLNYASFENAHWLTTDLVPTDGYYGVNRYRPAGNTDTSGTFTPVLNFGGAHVGQIYSTQQGKYTRTNGVTVVEVKLNLILTGSSVGTASITGLPVNSRAVSVGTVAFDVTAGITSPYAYVFAGDSEIFLRQNNPTGIHVLTDANFLDGTEIILTITVY